MSAERQSWLGPLPGWELLRLARRGHVTRARLMILYFLMIAVVLTPILWFNRLNPLELFFDNSVTLSIHELATFGSRFAIWILTAILAAIVAIAPGYAAAAIAEEKDQQTLELLLTSGLSDREIVVGKAWGRFVFIVSAALGGLPIVAIATLFGGITWDFLFMAATLVIGVTALTTSIGIHSACVTPDLRSALWRAYGICLLTTGGILFSPFLLCCFPIISYGTQLPSSSRTFVVAFQLNFTGLLIFVSLLVLRSAVRHLRGPEYWNTVRPAPPKAVENLEPKPKKQPVNPHHQRNIDIAWNPEDRQPSPKPPMREDKPLLWKERYVGRYMQSDLGVIVNGTCGVLAVSFLFIGFMLPNLGINYLALIACTAANWVYLSQLVVGLAATIARERQRHTLDALRGLPMSSRWLLSTKVQAVMERSVPWWLLSIYTGYLSFQNLDVLLGLSVAVFQVAGFVVILGIGTVLTIENSTELKAFRSLMPFAVVVWGLPVVVANFVDLPDARWFAERLIFLSFVVVFLGASLWPYAIRRFARME